MLFAGNIKQYKIRLFNGRKITEGILYNVTDSGVVISTIKGHKQTEYLDTIPYTKISKIRIWRKGKGAKGYWIGAGIGISSGIIAASLENDPEDKVLSRFGDVFLGIVYGQLFGGIGALIARMDDDRFIIGKDYSKFKLVYEELYNMSYVKALYDGSSNIK